MGNAGNSVFGTDAEIFSAGNPEENEVAACGKARRKWGKERIARMQEGWNGRIKEGG